MNTFHTLYRGKTVLVTGDTSFKGSWLCIWLLYLGAKVFGYSLPPRTERDHYLATGLEKKINHIDGDIRDVELLLKTFSTVQPEIAFHLVAQPLVLKSYKDPLLTFSTNIMGTVNFFEAVRKTKSVRAALNVTSDKCYENKELARGYREEDTLGGADPYSASKACSEIVTSAYQRSFFKEETAAHIASVRAGNVIGGGDWAENRIFPDCMLALQKDQPIIIRNPDAIRPWQHVLEPLNGYLTLAARLLEPNGQTYSGAWNFGPSKKNAKTVKQVVEEIIKQYGKGNYRIERQDERKPRETTCLMLDSSKSMHELNWHPVLSFEETIQWAVNEYQFAEHGSVEEIFQQRLRHIQEYGKMIG